MKKVKFVVGDRVAEKIDHYDECDEPAEGTVVEGIHDPNYTLVQWDVPSWDTFGKPVTLAVETKKLVTLKEAKEQFSVLEKEYKEYNKLIKNKMKEAGRLILESHKIAKMAGQESLRDMDDALYPLLNAMDSCGWNTSSFNC